MPSRAHEPRRRKFPAEPATENSTLPLYIVEDFYSAHGDEHDRILLNRLAHGDVQAMKTLYDNYSSLVFSLSWRIVGDEHCAEDVLYEVFLRLWSGVEKYDKALGRVGFWLTEITRRVALNHLRMRPTQREWPHAVSSIASEGSQRVVAILDKLPKGQRETLESVYFGGLTCVEIAAQNGVPVSSVKSQIRVAMQTIRQLRRGAEGTSDLGSEKTGEVKTSMTYRWFETYKTAVLETDWIKMQDRLRAAEFEINDRHRVLSEDHSGTPEERKALANATNGLMVLRRDVESWQTAQSEA